MRYSGSTVLDPEKSGKEAPRRTYRLFEDLDGFLPSPWYNQTVLKSQ
jgi:hypothetical protein